MEKLELKHLSGYLPYKLPIKIRQEEQISRDEWKWFEYDNFLNGAFIERPLKNITPILRPISDLTKEIEVNGEKFIPVKKLGYNENWVGLKSHFENTEYLPYKDIQKLYEWNFDIHDLIGKGLAIDINTLKNESLEI